MVQTREPAIPGREQPLIGAALVLGAASLWATFGIFAKVLYEDGFAPLELASVRTTVAFVAVALFGLTRPRSLRVPLRSIPFFIAYGVLGFALFEYVLFAALERTTVSIAVALLYTAPAFVVLISAVFWREHFGARRIVALVMVLVGVTLVTGAVTAVLRGGAALSTDALLLGLGAGFGYALYTLFSKVATERYGAFPSLFWSFLFAAIALAMLASPVSPFVRSPDSAAMLIALGIVPTVLPYALYLLALRRLRASTASMLASVEPVLAAMLAVILLGERMSAAQVGGMVLVAGAAVMLARQTAPDLLS